MGIQFSDRMVNIVHNYVVRKLVAIEGVMYYGTISGSLDRIFNGYGGYKLYKNTRDKAGALLYAIVHGHSFSDGNKRTGLLTTYLFLLYNGFSLYVPKDTTPFLERMADALNPDAPTEDDAINWVYENSSRSVVFTVLATFLTTYCRIWGTALLETVTKNLLEQDMFPMGVDREYLTDKTLKNSKKAPIKCG